MKQSIKRKNKEDDDDDYLEGKKNVRKKKTPTIEKCLLHCREDCTYDDIVNFTKISWKTAAEASKTRQDCFINGNEEIPTIGGYHRKCYQSYTNSKALSKFRSDNVSTKPKRDSRLKYSGILAPKECIVCQTRKVNKKTNSGYEDLEKCITTDGAETLVSYNEKVANQKLNLLITGKSLLEIVALELWHHRSCMRDVTRTAKPSNSEFQERQDLFQKLLMYVKTHVIENGDIRTLSSIRDHYEFLQKSQGLEIKGCLQKNIKSRLQNHFGNDIDVLSTAGGKEFLYCPESIQHFGMRKSASEKLSFEIKNIAQLIREEITTTGSEFNTWPPVADDLYGTGKVTPILNELLSALLSPGLVNSIGQDIIYGLTRGRQRTKKHVSLGLCLKRKTGSKEIITWLNKLGHCISYDEVNRIETTLAEFEVVNCRNRSYIPSTIQSNTFTTVVADNGDHNPDSLFGLSLHCTNMIMVQAPTHGLSASKSPIPPDYVYNRRRSFRPIDMELRKYIATKRSEPSKLVDIEREQCVLDEELSKQHDLMWIIARLQSIENKQEQTIPSWTGFNYLVAPKPPPHDLTDTIAYLPSINKSPTEMATVNEVLQLVNAKAEALQLSEIDLVFDHAIYCKALEILNEPSNICLKRKINLRMGGFHAECIFMSVISKRFMDGGLKDLIIEAGILRKGSTESALSSPHYNNAIRAHKCVYEALMRCKLRSFDKWLETNGDHHILVKFKESVELSQLLENPNSESLSSCLDLLDSEVMERYNDFEYLIRQEFGPTANYWLSYLEMVQALLDFQRSLRNGDWDLHLCSTEKMLPWFHAYDRHNYARHFTYYWCSQQKLAETHPQMHTEFVNGHFSVKRSSGRFNRLPSDQIIEQTMNKEQKGKGGIIGSSTSESTVQRWILTSHVIAKLVTDLKTNIGIHADTNQPKDLGKSRIKHDEQVVARCVDIIEEWSNPFEKSEELTSLSSGKNASKEIRDDIMNALKIGEKQLETFIHQRISSNEVGFYAPIKRLKLRTFTVLNVKKTKKVKGKEKTVESSLKTFSRFIVLQQKRNISIRDVLKFELGALPLSIANSDGNMVKSDKATLGMELKKITPEVLSIPENSIHIFDGMVFLQRVPKTCETFGVISDYLLNKIVNLPCKSVMFVTDRYLDRSTKSIERKQRDSTGVIRYTVRRRDQSKPKQYDKFLRDPDNKISLIEFILKDWANKPVKSFKGKDIYLTIDDRGYRLYEENGTIKQVDEEFISSTQEEADTKMFLCARFASMIGCSSVCIHTIDTDVLVMGYYYSAQRNSQFPTLDIPLFINILGKSGKTEDKIYDVTKAPFDNHLRRALPGLHALTGCDAVSAFYRKGKVKALKMLQRKPLYHDTLVTLGEKQYLCENDRQNIERFVCDMYGVNEGGINEARYQIFKKGVTAPELLPPTKDALDLHMNRANKVAFEWKNALIYNQDELRPEDHGWEIDENGELAIQWTTLAPAPEELLEYITCCCTKKNNCRQESCECRSNGLSCTDLCKCCNCENVELEEEIDYENEMDDDEYNSDDLDD